MTMFDQDVLIINGLRSRSGGSFTHLSHLLRQMDKVESRFDRIILIANRDLRLGVGNFPWLEKIENKFFDGSVAASVFWELFLMKKFLSQFGPNTVLLNLDGNYLGPYVSKTVTMSRDMLSFEPGIMRMYFPSLFWVRLLVIKFTQARAFNKSTAVIFLTEYARQVISKSAAKIKNAVTIPHGFSHESLSAKADYSIEGAISIVYTSPVWLFKGHLTILKGLEILDLAGIEFDVKFIGQHQHDNVEKLAFMRMMKFLEKTDGLKKRVKFLGKMAHADVLSEVRKSDIFIFGSLCENMPNSLVEAMGMGLPIVVARAGPSHDVGADSVVYYSAQDHEELADRLIELAKNEKVRRQLGMKAKRRSLYFDWSNTCDQTLDCVYKVAFQGESEEAV